MSRIVFFNIPAWGHTNPTVEVVRQLTTRGHSVRYYSFETFRETLEKAGAEVICCDHALPPEPDHLEKRVGKDFALLVEMVTHTTLTLDEQVCTELRSFAPDVIVSDSVCFWGKLFAQKLGIPYVCSTTTFAFNRQTARLMKPKTGEMLRSILGMSRIGKQVKQLQDHGYQIDHITDLLQNDNDTNTIVFTSREFQPMAETFSNKYAFVGPSLSVDVLEEKNKEKHRPLVYIALGTVMHQRKKFCRNCIEALKNMDVDAVISVGTQENLESMGTLPSNIKAEVRVDQLSVLKDADVFLTHCGMNSVSESIWYGVPMVLDPQQSEEAAVANRAAELGLGLLLEDERPATIRKAIRQILNTPDYLTKTNHLRETFIKAGGAVKAAEYILNCHGNF